MTSLSMVSSRVVSKGCSREVCMSKFVRVPFCEISEAKSEGTKINSLNAAKKFISSYYVSKFQKMPSLAIALSYLRYAFMYMPKPYKYTFERL